MPLLKDTRTTPPGGWRYIQPTTGLLMKADSLGELIANVIRHRSYKNIFPLDPSEVSADVQRQLCAKLPADFSRPE